MSDVEIKTTEVGKAARLAGLEALYNIGRDMATAYNHDVKAAEAGEDMIATVLDKGWGDLTEAEQATWAANVERTLFGLCQLHDQFGDWVNSGSVIPDEPEESAVPDEVLEALNRLLNNGAGS